MAGKIQQERKAEFKRYKEDVASEGKPFFPYAIFHDTIMAFVTVAVIIGVTCVWYYTAGDSQEGKGLEPGILGPWYTPEADAGTTSFIPRPDWFFYFLFYLLRVFKWPDSVILGSIGLPTVFLIMLLALPFYDRSPERRAHAPAGGDGRRDPRRHLDGRRSPGRAQPPRSRSRPRTSCSSRSGRRSRASPTTRRPSAAPRSSPRRAA